MKTLFAMSLALIVLACLPLHAAQQRAEVFPEGLIPLEGVLGLIDDINVTGMGSTSSFSFTNENGVKTTKVADGINRMAIVEDPTSGITCKVTKTYSSKDLAKLEEEQPELFMHLSSIPQTVGESEIEISVGVTSTFTATDADDLKAKHPEVYKLYKKYTEEQGIGRIHMGMDRPLRLRLGGDGGRIELGVGGDDDSDIDDDEDDDDEDGDDDDGDDEEDADDGGDEDDDDGR